MNPTETASIVALLSAAFPHWSPSKETVTLFHRSLHDLDYATVLATAESWVLTEERPPSIASLRRAVAERLGVLSISPAGAWAEVNAASYKYGVDEPRPPWSSPDIGIAVRAIGWWEICRGDNPTATRAQFLKVFAEIQTARDKEILGSVGLELGAERLALTNPSAVGLQRSQNQASLQQGAGK